MSSPFYAKGDPGAPVDAVSLSGNIATFWVGGLSGNPIGSVTLPSSAPVYHGLDATFARPLVEGAVLWIGDVEPINAIDKDIWIDVSGQAPTISTLVLNGMNVGAPFNQFLVAEGEAPMQWAHNSGTYPAGISPISTGGNIFGLPEVEGDFEFTVGVVNGFGSAVHTYTGHVYPPVAPSISTTTLGTFSQGVPVNVQMFASGSQPITWGISAPAGKSIPPASPAMAISSTGLLTGNPTTVGSGTSYGIVVTATNSVGSNSVTFSTPVVGIAPTISTTALDQLWKGFAFSQIPDHVGSGPITWTETGTRPAGISAINSTTGEIAGNPTTVGAYPSTGTWTVTATNAYGSNSKSYSGLVKESQPAVVETSIPAMTVGVAITPVQLTVSTGGPTITWSPISGMPPGTLSVNSSGLVTGIGSTPGVYTPVIRASNGVTFDDQTITMTVNGLTPAYRSASGVSGASGSSATTFSKTVPCNAGDTIIFQTNVAAPTTPTYSNGGTVSFLTAVSNGNTAPYGTQYVYSISGVTGAGDITVTSSAATTIGINAAAWSSVGSVGSVTSTASVSTAIPIQRTLASNQLMVAAFSGSLGINSVSGTPRVGAVISEDTGVGVITITASCTFSQNSAIACVLSG